jgi:hypothetical protein
MCCRAVDDSGQRRNANPFIKEKTNPDYIRTWERLGAAEAKEQIKKRR